VVRPREEGRTETEPTQTGVIEAVLPRAMYRVRLSEGRMVRAGVDVVCQASLVKLIVGDRVGVRLAGRDPTRAQIVSKL
jgi:translation initiation factor IF-1